ncbi:MAG: UDP-N-acetylglucosamine 1-carboxyvinyltransferase [Kiritimatiellae bacterium]|nr:UDP-N-acetylglucosamine 1-carboxyvinyltransferase [Kiritimatiellia bacterium]
MARLRITGGRPIAGRYRPSGNKNAALPMLAASLLTDEPVVLHNVPDIRDVAVMLELLDSVGVEVQRRGPTVRLWARQVRCRPFPEVLCRRIRASILLAGPMTARCGRAVLGPPGGDVIGRRRLDAHVLALRALGVEIEMGARYVFRRRAASGGEVLFDEASVTATENAMMVAALTPAETTFYNAACEPHVRDLAAMLRAMGAEIEGDGTHRIRIRGVERLRGTEATVGPDHIEMGSFLAAAAVTGGSLVVESPPDPLTCAVCRRPFDLFGLTWRRTDEELTQPLARRLRVRPALHGPIPKIEDGPWPAFPSDLLSIAIVMATQAAGATLFFEKMFESRLYFVDRLMDMGAHIVVCDPHRVLVTGPARLHGGCLPSPDIRAGMSMVVAALCARGESVIENAEVIDRGYERLDERLAALGAQIRREPDGPCE